jgi:hypothetical protein
LGKEKAVDECMTAYLANGQILLEDIPGAGKTHDCAQFHYVASHRIALSLVAKLEEASKEKL